MHIDPPEYRANANDTSVVGWTTTGMTSCVVSATSTDPTVPLPGELAQFNQDNANITNKLIGVAPLPTMSKVGTYNAVLICKTIGGNTQTKTMPFKVVQ
jgi:hypothetical protein